MRKFLLSLAFAASVTVVAAMQANGSGTSSPNNIPPGDLLACRFLVQKMEKSPSANTWRNRLRTWKCRDDLSPGTPKTTALLKELDQ